MIQTVGTKQNLCIQSYSLNFHYASIIELLTLEMQSAYI